MLRVYRPEDWRFVYDSWTESWLRGRSHTFRDYPKEDLHETEDLRLWIENLVRRSDVLLACLEESEEIVVGFAAGRSGPGDVGVLHYVYTKHRFRRQGVATALIDGLRRRLGEITHHSFETFAYKKHLKLGLDTKFSPVHAVFPLPKRIVL